MIKDMLMRWLAILILIAISILLIKLFIWLLPILLIIFTVYLIYTSLKKDKYDEVVVEKASKNKVKKNKNKKIIIIDEEVND